MKRILLLCLTFLFLSTSSGISFYFHFCGKVLDGISITGKASCACEDGAESADCCHDKVHVVKIKDRFVASQRLLTPEVKMIDFVACFKPSDIFYAQYNSSSQLIQNILLFDPPNLCKAPSVLRT